LVDLIVDKVLSYGIYRLKSVNSKSLTYDRKSFNALNRLLEAIDKEKITVSFFNWAFRINIRGPYLCRTRYLYGEDRYSV